MNIISLTLLFITIVALLWQINVMTRQGMIFVESLTTYATESARSGWKYSMSFIQDSHESKLDKLRKHKESEDLKRKIRIENIENELKEGNTVLDKGMPNYYNLLLMFGESILGQYELACRIDLMKDTLFVSESLASVSQIIKYRIGEQLDSMKMKKIVDKMIQHNIYTEIQTSLYTQQNVLLNNNQFKQQHLIVLANAFDDYDTAWTLSITNELMNAAKHESENLTHIQNPIISYNIYSNKECDCLKTINDNFYHSEYNNFKSTKNYYNNYDPKCISQNDVYEIKNWNHYYRYPK